MKSCALLSCNLPSVIDRSNVSPSRQAFFYSNNDPNFTQGAQKTDNRTDSRNGASRKKIATTG